MCELCSFSHMTFVACYINHLLFSGVDHCSRPKQKSVNMMHPSALDHPPRLMNCCDLLDPATARMWMCQCDCPDTIITDCDVIKPEVTPKKSNNDCIDSTMATISNFIAAKHSDLTSDQGEQPSMTFANIWHQLDLVKNNIYYNFFNHIV